MLPNPMHPAIVHFPIVLMFILPLVAIGALWAIRRGMKARIAWAFPAVVAAGLALSVWVSIETGEETSERVERVVPKQPLHAHEEMAELFLTLAGGLVVVAAAGMLGGTLGRAARVVATVGAVGVAAVGVRVGHTGGQLVYEHGAAAAYAEPAAAEFRTGTALRVPDAEHADREHQNH